MRISLILGLLLGAMLPEAASARTFTSVKGVNIQAEIATATATSVTLKEPSGNKVTVSVDQLVPADRNYIQLWLTKNVPEIRVTPNFVRSTRTPHDNSSGNRPAKGGKQVQVLNMSVEIESWDTDHGLPDGELVYTLIGRSMEHRNRYKILAVQSSDFSVPPSGRTKVEFKTVENYFEDHQDKSRGSRCVGYVLLAKRRSDNREVWSNASSAILKKSIPAIARLQAGEETDDEFVPIPDPPAITRDSREDVIKIE
jgi:hypothetical protein